MLYPIDWSSIPPCHTIHEEVVPETAKSPKNRLSFILPLSTRRDTFAVYGESLNLDSNSGIFYSR